MLPFHKTYLQGTNSKVQTYDNLICFTTKVIGFFFHLSQSDEHLELSSTDFNDFIKNDRIIL